MPHSPVSGDTITHGVPATVDTGCECAPCARCKLMMDRFIARSRYGAPLFRVVRRIQALRAINYTPTQLGDLLGMDPGYVEWLTEADTGHVSRFTFARVAAGYETLSARPQGPVADPRWPSPLAWDEPDTRDRGHRIDDPIGRPITDEAPPIIAYGPKCRRQGKCPHESCTMVGRVQHHDTVDPMTVVRVMRGDVVPTTRAEKETIVNAWLAAGRTWSSLERLTGWQIEKYRKAGERTRKAGVAA